MCGAGGVWADPDVIGCSSRVFIMVELQVSCIDTAVVFTVNKTTSSIKLTRQSIQVCT